MFKLFIILKCCIIIHTQTVENRIWLQMLNTNFTNITLQLNDYLVFFIFLIFRKM